MPHSRYDNALERRLLFLERACVGVTADIVVLTGGTQADEGYMSSGCAIRQIPQCGYDETCWYRVHKGVPRAEEIASALLQLNNNPRLFDKWAMKNGLAFKANGQVFSHAL